MHCYANSKQYVQICSILLIRIIILLFFLNGLPIVEILSKLHFNITQRAFVVYFNKVESKKKNDTLERIEYHYCIRSILIWSKNYA